MNSYASKNRESKGNSRAQTVSKQQKSGSPPSFQLIDNRLKAVTQRKLQTMARKSSKASQLRTVQEVAQKYSLKQNSIIQQKGYPVKIAPSTVNGPKRNTIQMKSDRKYNSLYKGSGTLADYFIDPMDQNFINEGKSPPSSRPPWWSALKNATGYFPESSLVQGHLVNHHVGGEDNMQNLSPITRSANTTMLNFFEKEVKNHIVSAAHNTAGNIVVHYKVDATGYGNIKDIGVLGGHKSLQTPIAPFLPNFAEWIGAEYDIYPRVKGNRSDLNGKSIFKSPTKKWVKNENKDEKGTF